MTTKVSIIETASATNPRGARVIYGQFGATIRNGNNWWGDVAGTIVTANGDNTPSIIRKTGLMKSGIKALTPDGTPQTHRVYACDGVYPSICHNGGTAGQDQQAVLVSGTKVVPFAQNTRDEVRVVGDGRIAGALSAEIGMK